MAARAGANLLYSQFFVKLPYPAQKFSGQTVIVTGSNTGLGREAAEHFVRLDAEKVILAVRNLSKGEEARKFIENRTGKTGVVEVWPLDLASYASVKAFVAKADQLSRLDVVLENAGISTDKFTILEDNECAVLYVICSEEVTDCPGKIYDYHQPTKFNVIPRLTVVSSDLHHFSTLSAKSHPSIFQAMNDKGTAQMGDRYQDSKLLEVLYCRELAAAITESQNLANSPKPTVTLNVVNPGFCESELLRNPNRAQKLAVKVMARSTEEGSRTLVHAAEVANGDTHGKYLSNCKEARFSTFVTSPKGKETSQRVWIELNEILERIQPGVVGNV